MGIIEVFGFLGIFSFVAGGFSDSMLSAGLSKWYASISTSLQFGTALGRAREY